MLSKFTQGGKGSNLHNNKIIIADHYNAMQAAHYLLPMLNSVD